MYTKFEKHIESNALFSKNDKLIAAVSGGRDSMLMLHLLKEAGYNISVAHCNFQLRGNDSIADEDFVKGYCQRFNIPFFAIKFDTKEYTVKHKFSTQEAARKLRYDWFEQLSIEHGFQYILTAHHKDDNLETILHNLIKGSKLRGYAGIGNKKNKIVRPLMCYTRKDIDRMTDLLSIGWREGKNH